MRISMENDKHEFPWRAISTSLNHLSIISLAWEPYLLLTSEHQRQSFSTGNLHYHFPYVFFWNKLPTPNHHHHHHHPGPTFSRFSNNFPTYQWAKSKKLSIVLFTPLSTKRNSLIYIHMQSNQIHLHAT